MTDTTAQHYQLLIRSTAERIWQALISPEFTRQYFYGVHVDTTAAAGTPFRHLAEDGTVLVEGAVLVADAPRTLVVTWLPRYDPVAAAQPASRVAFTITQHAPGVCLVSVVHDRLEGSPRTADNVRGLGWLTVLSGLKTLLETGAPLLPVDE